MITRIAVIAGKEFRQMFRDMRLLGIVLLMPIIQLLLFAYAISFDVQNVPLWVVDNDRSVSSRDYIASLTASGTFQLAGISDSFNDGDSALEFGQARVAVLIPSGFGAEIARGNPGQVGILVDGSEPNSARVSRAAVIAMSANYSLELTKGWAVANGIDLSGQGMLAAQVRTWYNPELKSSDFLIPGLMVVILMIVTVQQTAVSLVRERELNTSDQLALTPLRSVELIIGKLLPGLLLAFVNLGVIVGLGVGVFGVPMRGDPLALIAGATLFIISCLGIGFLISAVVPSVEVASIAALLVAFLPAFLLSDFAFPLDQIPFVLEWFSRVFPGRYMVTISRDVFLKGAGFEQVWRELGALCIFAVVVTGLAAMRYSRRAR